MKKVLRGSWDLIIVGIIGGTLSVLVQTACFPTETQLKGGTYAKDLHDCNVNSKTLCESIACENVYRAQAGRFPRDVPNECRVVPVPDSGTVEGGAK